MFQNVLEALAAQNKNNNQLGIVSPLTVLRHHSWMTTIRIYSTAAKIYSYSTVTESWRWNITYEKPTFP